MAGGGIAVAGAKEYPGKFTTRVLITCIVAAFGGLIFGYDLGVSGGVTSMDVFLKTFFPAVYLKESSASVSTNQYCKFDSETLTFFTSCLYLAALFASLFVASTITRVWGRRITMLSGGGLFLAGALVNAFSQQVWMLYVGRILLGLGIGFSNQSVPIYLSETAPYKYRGALNIMFQLFITVGILAASLANFLFGEFLKGNKAWQFSLGGAAVPALIITVGSFFLPDTPNSLIERGKHEEAKTKLLKLRGVDDVDEEFFDLVVASEASKQVKNPWRTLLTKKYRPQLIFAICIPAFQQLTGVNVIMFYAPVLFQTLGFGASTSLISTCITSSVNVGATVISIFTVDKWGRKKLFLGGGIQMFLTQVVVGLAIALKFGFDGNPGELSKAFSMTLVIVICIYVAGFAWSWGPLGWLVPSEIFQLEVRSAAQSINVGVNMIFTFAIAQVFTAMLCHLKFVLFFIFSAFLVVMSCFIYFFLPETNGVPIEEMGRVWEKHWYWRKFVVT